MENSNAENREEMGKMPFREGVGEVGGCENPVGLSMYEGHMETVEYIWVNIGACLIGFCHKTAEMHSLCI